MGYKYDRNFKKREVITAAVFRAPLLLSQALPGKDLEHKHLQIPISNPAAKPWFTLMHILSSSQQSGVCPRRPRFQKT